MQLVIAEKPSVARDLARVLGVRPTGKNCFLAKDRVITWCVGHLVELDEPASYDGRWKVWRLDTLPMIPSQFKLRPVPSTREQLREVCRLLRDKRFSEVVNACDAGREGELIFRYVYQLAGSRLPIRRLWISSLTDEAIRQGFSTLKPGVEMEKLADAARCRSEADWLVGLNATRAVTVRQRTGPDSMLYSIGRVQTPTLAILVEREKAIQNFVPQDYWQLRAELTTTDGARFAATWSHDKAARFGNASAASEVRDRCRAHGAADDPEGPVVESLKQSKTREPPPLLFDLTSLQRTANKRFGLSAQATLDAAQALYERHKILTYPRTDARHLSSDMAATLPKIFSGLADLDEYAPFARTLLANQPRPSKRFFDDSKIQDHHAIVPTGKAAKLDALERNERRIFDLVVRRFLGAFYPDAEFAQTEVVVRVGPATESAPPRNDKREDKPALVDDVPLLALAPPPPDRFQARGRVRLVAGWQEVAGFGGEDADAKSGVKKGKKKEGDEDEAAVLPPLAQGQRLDGSFETLAKKTKPPARHSEATLLSAMENAGKTLARPEAGSAGRSDGMEDLRGGADALDDDELRAAMKDSGLGTPATRAATIETLLKRGFVAREGKHLTATPVGVALIDGLPVPSLASPELTGTWEARLARMARGEDRRDTFMADIGRYVHEVVDAIRAAAPMRAVPLPAASAGQGKKWARERSAGRGRKPAAKRGLPATSEAARPAPESNADARPRDGVSDLLCPRCRSGHLMTGKRGWGCSRWREGCDFVVWFEESGVRRSEADLRDLLSKP
ncbi:MAG: DNA topoisomerase [Polyangia bacterium]